MVPIFESQYQGNAWDITDSIKASLEEKRKSRNEEGKMQRTEGDIVDNPFKTAGMGLRSTRKMLFPQYVYSACLVPKTSCLEDLFFGVTILSPGSCFFSKGNVLSY